MFGAPVLLTGLSAQVLSKFKISSIDHHYKVLLERLQRLYPAIPSSAAHFLAGYLPAVAILHKRQFSLLVIIARLGTTTSFTGMAPRSCL